MPTLLSFVPTTAARFLRSEMGDALDGLMANLRPPAQPHRGRPVGGAYIGAGGRGVFQPSHQPGGRISSATRLVQPRYSAPPRNPMATSLDFNIGLSGAPLGAQPKQQQQRRIGVANAMPATMGLTGTCGGGIAPVMGRGVTPPVRGRGVTPVLGGPHAAAGAPYAPAIAAPGPMAVAAPLSHPPLQWGFSSEQNARWRKYMEDEHTAVADFAGRPGSLFAGVYDGHGGRTAVEFVTSHLHTQLERELRSGGAAAAPHEALRQV